jgi:DNA-binding NtrC family response regulator
MKKILLADNSPRDAERISSLFDGEADGLRVEVCHNGVEAEAAIASGDRDVVAVVLLMELPGPPSALELLLKCRQHLPGRPIVVMSSALDASLATRASVLGARDFLEKPLDLDRVKQSLRSLIFAHDPVLPLVAKLNEVVRGDSAALRAALRQVAKVIPHPEIRVLLFGESGTGKELLAQGIHRLSPDADAPCVAVNVGAIPKELMESQLFGHERGAFTGAVDAHRGYLEEAGGGTLFLDEIGELEQSLQVKLLRVIQEKKFRRLKGDRDLDFRARLVCATNRHLAQSVQDGSFRRDLFHRVAEVAIHVPPLRERHGDLEKLLEYFLEIARKGRPVRFARETLTILKSYPFPGNIRELENLVSSALIECEGELILPQHLPLKSMGVFLTPDDLAPGAGSQPAPPVTGNGSHPPAPGPHSQSHRALFKELEETLPPNWLELPYKEVAELCQHAFDRTYLPPLIERHRHNLTRATKAAGVDKKTFDKHWKEAGLPPLRADEEKSHD